MAGEISCLFQSQRTYSDCVSNSGKEKEASAKPKLASGDTPKSFGADVPPAIDAHNKAIEDAANIY